MSELSQPSQLDFGAIDFNEIEKADFVQELKKEIDTANKKLKEYEKETEVSFDSVFAKLFEIEEPVNRIAGIFYSLYELDLTDQRMKISNEISELLTNFGSSITLNPVIFNRVKSCYEQKDQLKLSSEQLRIVQKYFDDFKRNGALLNDSDKENLKKIDLKLSELSLKFKENSLKATNKDYLHVETKDQLDGIPEDVLNQAAAKAKEQNLSGYVFTLHAPSYMPFMTYAKNRELRAELYKKRASIALGGEFDNSSVIIETLKYRFKRAQLLGYKNHAHFVLEKRMAKEPAKVYELLETLRNSSWDKALLETERLKKLLKEETGEENLKPWDTAYYSEIEKMKELAFDDEKLKPYFQLEKVVDGVFKVASLMYNLKFTERKDLPVYHKEVKVFEVSDIKTQKFIGLLYTDYFPRSTKGSGAWCDQFQAQGYSFGKIRRPHVINAGNFNPSSEGKPSLLNFNEVLTLFHEFGHGLHTLLSDCHYTVLSGTNVHWDFVELPSQIMENWCYQKECLDLFANHYETNEKIPQSLVDKLKELLTFRQATKIIRQVQFAALDMAYHDRDPNEINDIEAFEKEIFDHYKLMDSVSGTAMSPNFGHLFGGGYSAGYYSYHWAEVLDADAFEVFENGGIFNPEIARRFRDEILSRGGTEDPEVLYRNFKGADASPEALLKRSGLN